MKRSSVLIPLGYSIHTSGNRGAVYDALEQAELGVEAITLWAGSPSAGHFAVEIDRSQAGRPSRFVGPVGSTHQLVEFAKHIKIIGFDSERNELKLEFIVDATTYRE